MEYWPHKLLEGPLYKAHRILPEYLRENHPGETYFAVGAVGGGLVIYGVERGMDRVGLGKYVPLLHAGVATAMVTYPFWMKLLDNAGTDALLSGDPNLFWGLLGGGSGAAVRSIWKLARFVEEHREEIRERVEDTSIYQTYSIGRERLNDLFRL